MSSSSATSSTLTVEYAYPAYVGQVAFAPYASSNGGNSNIRDYTIDYWDAATGTWETAYTGTGAAGTGTGAILGSSAAPIERYTTVTFTEVASTKFRINFTNQAGTVGLWYFNLIFQMPGRRDLLTMLSSSYTNLDSVIVSLLEGSNVVPTEKWVNQEEYDAYKAVIKTAEALSADKTSTAAALLGARDNLSAATTSYNGQKKAGLATAEFQAKIKQLADLLVEGKTYHLRYRVPAATQAEIDAHNTKVGLGQNPDEDKGKCCNGNWDMHRKIEDYKRFMGNGAVSINGYDLAWVLDNTTVQYLNDYKAAIAAGITASQVSTTIAQYQDAIDAITSAKTDLQTNRKKGPRASTAVTNGSNIAHYIAYVNEDRADNYGIAMERAFRNSTLTSCANGTDDDTAGGRTVTWLNNPAKYQWEFFFSQAFNVKSFSIVAFSGRVAEFDLEYLDMTTGEWKMAFQKTDNTAITNAGTGSVNATTAGQTWTFTNPIKTIGWRWIPRGYVSAADGSIYAWRMTHDGTFTEEQ